MSGKPEDLRGAGVWFAGAFFNVRPGKIEACPVSSSPVETFAPDKAGS